MATVVNRSPVTYPAGRDSILFSRPLQSTVFAPSSTPQAINMPKDRNIASVMFYFSGTINVTAVGAQVGNGIVELIKSCRIVRNGSEVICDVPLESLSFANIYRQRAASVIQPAWGVLGASSFEAEGWCDFSFINGLRAKDSILQALGSSELTLQFSFFPLSAASTATYTVTGSVATQVFEEMELPGQDGQTSRPTHVSRHTYEERIYTGAVTESLLLPKNRLFSSFVVETKTAAGALSNAILGTLTLKVGSDIRVQYNLATVLKEASMRNMSWQLPTGYYVLDLTSTDSGVGRSLRQCLSTYGAGQDVKLEYTTVAAGIVGITYRGFEVLQTPQMAGIPGGATNWIAGAPVY